MPVEKTGIKATDQPGAKIFFWKDVREIPLPVLFLKRGFDIVAGIIGTSVFIATYPIISLLIKLESRGPVIYAQERIGTNKRLKNINQPDGKTDRDRGTNLGGKPFTLYKYRSMRSDAEKNGPQLSGLAADDRTTRTGKWLRALHIDELPQFWNILKGDMSFIGPRPERPHFTLEYQKSIPHYNKRTLFTKPGLTGLAQITLGYDDSIDSVVRKSYFDLSYGASLANFWVWIKMESWILFHTMYYIMKRTDRNGTIQMPARLEKIKQLPFAAAPKEEAGNRKITGIMRFNCFKNNVILSDLTPDDLVKKVQMLSAFGQKEIQVSLNPKRQFDLEDLNFLVNLVHKVKEVDGQVIIRNEHPMVDKMLKELHLHKIVNVERIRKFMPNFLTIDVECWFHAYNLKEKISKSQWHKMESRVVDNISRILTLLKKHNATATFFVLGWVAKRYPETVRMIDEAGHEIGTHGFYHNLITDMTREEFEDDLVKSLETLQGLISRPITGHRGSNFTIIKPTLWALDILCKYGLTYDSSIFPVGRKRYGIRDYPNRMPHTIQLQNGKSIKEFPLSTLAIGKKLMPIGGGGYLRLYPYRVTDRYIEQMNISGYPGMVYVHPWELDTQQARLNVRPDKKFQHYVNLHTTDWKLSHLLERFHFTSISEGMKDANITRIIKDHLVKMNLGSSDLEVLPGKTGSGIHIA